RPIATTAATAARATVAAGEGAAGSAGSATGAGGAGGATGSARGAAGAGGAGPTTDHHCLSWPLSRQLQRLGVDSGGHCLSWTTPPLRSFTSGFFSETAAVLGASESAAALGASESAAALGASESAAALGARASPATGPSSAEALHTFTLDSGASRCFFCDYTKLTPLAIPVPVSLVDPTGGLVVARASSVLPCPADPSGSLSGLHLPTFLTNLACQVAASSQVSASSQLAASYSCRVLSHRTLLWHHRLGHPFLPRLRSMHSRLLVSGLPRSLPSLPCLPVRPFLPCIEGWQCAAPHSSELPPTIAPLQTLHMDIWGPAPIGGTDQECYFLLVVDDYTRYTTVFPLRCKAEVSGVLIHLIRATRRQLRERFSQDFPVLCLHSDKGGEFSSDLLAEFCQDEGIVQSFTLPASPQKNGIAERRIGLIHAATPHFLWAFVVRYAAHQLNLWPHVSGSETSPTLRWTGKVGDASVFPLWGALSLFRDAKASKLSSRTLRCVFLGFPTDAPPWQFYHPRSHRVFSSQDVTFDESVCYYRLHPHASHPGPTPSGVSHVDSPPLVEPLEISSDSSGPAEGGDPATYHMAATRHSPRLEIPPAQPAAAEPRGAETEGEGSGGAATGVAVTRAVGDPARGPGAGQPPHPDLLATLSSQTIRTAGARGTGGTARGAGGAAGAGGTRGAAGAGGAGATSPRGATGAGGTGPTSPGDTVGAGGAGGSAGAGGAGARGTGGAQGTFPRSARTEGATAAGASGAARAGGATGAAGSGGTCLNNKRG
ncbi:unnamed protein product, partial [Closterium sp. NIES-54]